jgi:hypothetical protein
MGEFLTTGVLLNLYMDECIKILLSKFQILEKFRKTHFEHMLNFEKVVLWMFLFLVIGKK